MSGLRERKRRKTFAAIHHAAMALFAERGYGAVTVADIAEAAEVSRATVFTYYPTKEDIVLGEAPLALESLRATLDDAVGHNPVLVVVQAWLRTLTGWIEPDMILQRKLASEVPAVDAARSRVLREIETIIADALAREMGPGRPLVPKLVAGALAAALETVETEAVDRMQAGRRPLTPNEVDELVDDAFAFVEHGLAGLRDVR